MSDEVIHALVEQCGWSAEQAILGLRAGFKCEYCGRCFLVSIEDYDTWQRDHIIPVTRGGTNHRDNIALACKLCNFMKRDWVPAERLDPLKDREAAIEAVKAHLRTPRAKKQIELDKVRTVVEAAQARCVRAPGIPHELLHRTSA